LQRLITELKHLQCVPKCFFDTYTDGLLDEWTYPAQHELSTLQQSSRMLPMPSCPNLPFSAKPSRTSTREILTRPPCLLILRRWMPTKIPPPPRTQCHLHPTYIMCHRRFLKTVSVLVCTMVSTIRMRCRRL
jgi:hypothetical protein